MEKENNLKTLENEYEELRNNIESLRGDIVDFELTPEYQEYLSLNEEEKKNKYSQQYEIYQRIDESIDNKDKFYDKLVNAAKEAKEEKENKISNNTKIIEANKESIKELTEKLNMFTAKAEEIKNSEAYLKGEEQSLLKFEEMQANIELYSILIKQREEKINNLEKEINDINAYLEDLKDSYPEVFEIEVQEKNSMEEEKEDQEVEPHEKENKDKNKEKDSEEKQLNNRNKGNAFYKEVAAERNNEKEEETTKEEENNLKDDKDLKSKFDDLYEQAINGDLTDGEYEKLATIMQDKANYEKLGIMPKGIFNNKSKVILKAMLKKATNTYETISTAKEELNIVVHNALDDKDVISTDKLRRRGISILSKNPDQKLASEETLKEIMKLDRENLNENQKKIYDDAKKHLNNLSALRKSISVYSEVTNKSKNERSHRRGSDVLMLGENREDNIIQNKEESPSILTKLQDMTEENIQVAKFYGNEKESPNIAIEDAHDKR